MKKSPDPFGMKEDQGVLRHYFPLFYNWEMALSTRAAGGQIEYGGKKK